jgi:hypothetical protein
VYGTSNIHLASSYKLRSFWYYCIVYFETSRCFKLHIVLSLPFIAYGIITAFHFLGFVANVFDYGAIGDGHVINTLAIQAAVSAIEVLCSNYSLSVS